MTDLTNMKGDYILIKPDAKTITAFDAWKDKLSVEDKDKFTIDDTGLIVCPPDPLDTVKTEREEVLALVDDNADSMTDVVRLKFDGVTFAAIIQKVAKPAELEEPK